MGRERASGGASWSRGILVAVLAAGSASAAFACSLLLPLGDVQCNRSEDCRGRGPAFATAVCVANECVPPGDAALPAETGDAGDAAIGDASTDGRPDPWGCLARPSVLRNSSSPVDVEFVSFDFVGEIIRLSPVDAGAGYGAVVPGYPAVPGASVRACDNSDRYCTDASSQTAVANDAGIAHLTIPGNFDGWYSVELDGDFPGLYVEPPLLAGDPLPAYAISGTSYATVEPLRPILNGVTMNQDPDAGLGHLYIVVYDCNDVAASDISFTGVVAEAHYYFYADPNSGMGGVINVNATATDRLGLGVFINVPEGRVSFKRSRGAQELFTRDVWVRSGAVTTAVVRARAR
jgi:hypothetical protein